jgi:hypothetical protein
MVFAVEMQAMQNHTSLTQQFSFKHSSGRMILPTCLLAVAVHQFEVASTSQICKCNIV